MYPSTPIQALMSEAELVLVGFYWITVKKCIYIGFFVYLIITLQKNFFLSAFITEMEIKLKKTSRQKTT